MAPVLIVVEQVAPRRFVASAIGTTYSGRGRSPEYALGSLMLHWGWRLRVAALLLERTHANGFVAVPIPHVTVTRTS